MVHGDDSGLVLPPKIAPTQVMVIPIQQQKDVTTLIISHRVTTLSQADLILVLENGQITQQGTHAELCSQPGLYQRINSIQNALEEELTQAKAAEGVN